MIALLRCDDRLIHGQIMTRIVQHYFVKRILAVDDFTAQNPILKSIFEKAVPPNMTAKVESVENAGEFIEKFIEDDVKTLILCRTPLIAEKLFNAHPNLPQSLMIGPVASKPDSISFNFGSYLNQEEITACENMNEKGVDVFFQVVPGEKRTNWVEAKKNANVK